MSNLSSSVECEGTSHRRREVNQSSRLLADTIVELTKRLIHAEGRADMYASTVRDVERELEKRLEAPEKALKYERDFSANLGREFKEKSAILEKHEVNRKKLLLEIERLQRKIKRTHRKRGPKPK
jgi:hypothetical protein